MPTTLALLGDSSIDNRAYARQAPAVVHHVRAALEGTDWKVDMGALDGDVINDVFGQIERCVDATHFVLSVGGNNALGLRYLLEERVSMLGQGIIRLHEALETFRTEYAGLLDTLIGRSPNLLTCTIYEPDFPEPLLQRASVAALSHFNDAIVRASIARGISVIDLRTALTERADREFAFEPSGQGGEKIGRLIAHAVRTHDFAATVTRVYAAGG